MPDRCPYDGKPCIDDVCRSSDDCAWPPERVPRPTERGAEQLPDPEPWCSRHGQLDDPYTCPDCRQEAEREIESSPAKSDDRARDSRDGLTKSPHTTASPESDDEPVDEGYSVMHLVEATKWLAPPTEGDDKRPPRPPDPIGPDPGITENGDPPPEPPSGIYRVTPLTEG